MFGLLLFIVLFIFGLSLTEETIRNFSNSNSKKTDSKDLIALLVQITILLSIISFITVYFLERII